MKQQIAVITLGITDLERSKAFYINGFGWRPLHEDVDTVMYQMNGFVLSTWLQSELEDDVSLSNLPRGGALTLAHNVDSPNDVQVYMKKLAEHGGKILRPADSPSHGGVRGYIADPDNHIWEVIYNPVWKVDNQGQVTFAPSP